LRGDVDQLTQALLNLVRNAAQHAPPKSAVTVRTRVIRQVTVHGKRHRLAVCVDVIDHGPGVPPELHEQIFFPLVTTRADGNGLGLPVAQSLVTRHGGLVECESVPGHTMFSMILPVENEDE
jgi:two-component system nitrogen regulation sensor histidine kinase GlnL